MLDRQPPAVQDFLLRTAVPERLCAPLWTPSWRPAPTAAAPGPAAAPPPTAPGGALLEAVVQAGLFLTPLDEPRSAPLGAGAGPRRRAATRRPGAGSWYRYHPLFRDLLLEQLRARRGPAAAARPARPRRGLVRRRRAGGGGPAPPPGRRRRGGRPRPWWRRHVHPALEAGRLAGAGALAGPAAPGGGGGARPWPWPGPGWRTAAGGSTPCRGCWPTAGALLDGAARPAPRLERPALEGQLAALGATVRFLEGDLAGTLAEAGAALARLPPALHYARGWAAGYAVQAAMAADGPGAADRWLAAAGGGARGPRRAGPGKGAGRPGLRAGSERAVPGRGARRPGPAGAGPGAGAALLPPVGERPPGSRALRVGPPRRGGAALRGRAGGADLAPLILQREATFGLALALQAQGRPVEADAAVERLAGALLATGNTRQLAALDAFRVRLALLRGEPRGRAGRGADRPRAARHLLGTMMDVPPLTRVWAALGAARPAPPAGAADPARRRAELDALLASAERLHLDLRRAQALALRALALDAQGQEDAALDALEAALALGQPGGLRRTFLDLGPPWPGCWATWPPGAPRGLSAAAPGRRGRRRVPCFPGPAPAGGGATGATWWSR